jgi:hypothetical protein
MDVKERIGELVSDREFIRSIKELETPTAPGVLFIVRPAVRHIPA